MTPIDKLPHLTSYCSLLHKFKMWSNIMFILFPFEIKNYQIDIFTLS